MCGTVPNVSPSFEVLESELVEKFPLLQLTNQWTERFRIAILFSGLDWRVLLFAEASKIVFQYRPAQDCGGYVVILALNSFV